MSSSRRDLTTRALVLALAGVLQLTACRTPVPSEQTTAATPAASGLQASADHGGNTDAAAQDARMNAWRDARYGMFIHWGPYAVAAGEWKGKGGYDYGEWIMSHAKIPVAEYRGELAGNLRGRKFDAAEWVRLAKESGMKYIVLTSKHHDGFAMFDTKVSDYNSVDATPFGRDAVRELAEETRRQGLRFGVYYSHILDWSSPDATPNSFNNTWDFKLDHARFDSYWNTTVIPHVTELLTQYGQITEVWFDIGKETPQAKADQLMALVRKLQPDAVVNNRIKSFSPLPQGDFASMGDNEIPQAGFARDFESAMTLNNTWGYSRNDHAWKSSDAVVMRLVDVAGKGGNLLLNVGPDGEGEIPKASQDILRQAGRWLARNGEAIYGTRPLRARYEFDWGSVTTKPGKLYLNVIDWSPQLTLHGLQNTIVRASLLASPSKTLRFEQDTIPGTQIPRLRLHLPDRAPDAPVSVVVLETEPGDAPRMLQELIQQGSGRVRLNLAAAELEPDANDPASNAADWTFQVFQPGSYRVELTSLYRGDGLAYRNPLRIDVAGQTLRAMPRIDQRPGDTRSTQHPYAEAVSTLGTLKFERAGEYRLTLTSELAIPDSTTRLIPWQQDKTKLRALDLVPAQGGAAAAQLR